MKYVMITDVLATVVAVDENKIPEGKTPKEYVSEMYGKEDGIPLLHAKVDSQGVETTELLGIPAGMGLYLKHDITAGDHLFTIPLATDEEETTVMMSGELKSVLSDKHGSFIPPDSFTKKRPVSKQEVPKMIVKLKMSGTPRVCLDCGETFYLSIKDQDFFESRGLMLPKRCPSCRKRRREQNVTNQSLSVDESFAKVGTLGYY